MKVTALIPDDLLQEVKTLSQGKNITEALIIVMREWVSAKRLRGLNEQLQKKPLKFAKLYTAAKVREVNRQSK